MSFRGAPQRFAVWTRWLRVGLLPTALCNTWVAAALAGASEADVLQIPQLWLIPALLYLFGMGLNDFADRGRDATLYPDRPLPSGAIAVGTARVVLWVLPTTALLIAGTVGLHTILATSAVIAAIAAYDLWLKDHAIGGPVSMGTVRALLYPLAWTTIQARNPELVIPTLSKCAAIALFTYVALLTRFSMEEERARPEVLRGRLLALVVMTSVVLIATAVRVPPHAVAVATASLLLWLSWLIFAAAPAWTAPKRAGLTTFRLLQGLLALDLLWSVSYDRWVIAAAIAALWSWVLIGFPIPRILMTRLLMKSTSRAGTS